DPASASRATAPCAAPNQALGVGCFVAVTSPQLGTVTASTYQVNLLDYGELYGEGVTLFDLKVAKTLKFSNRRLNVGADIYNVFTSDAVASYTTTYTLTGTNNWQRPTGLVNPRFVRASVQFSF